MKKNSSCKIFIVFFLILIFSFFNSIFAQKFTNENNFTYSANLSAATNINNALMDLEESKSIIDEVYNQNQIIPSPVKPQNRPSVALVLSGGGARGFAHLPVLEMIEDYGIPVDMIIGTSIGSIIGGIYSSGYTVSEMEEQFFSLNWSEIFQDKVQELYETRLGKSEKNATPFSIDFKKTNNGFNLNLGSGILSGQYAYELIKKMTLAVPSDCDFDRLPIPFRAVTVNLTSGNVEVFSKGDIAEAIRASMSIPAFFKPFEIDGQYYLDGGTRNNTPIDIAVKMGYDIIIVSEISSLLNEDLESFNTSPAEALKQMINLEQSVRNRDIYKKASLVMFPDYANCTILDFAKSKEIYKSSKISIEQYRKEFERIKKEIEEKTESLSSATPKRIVEFESSYKDNPLPFVTSVSVSGGNEQDKKIVERAFSSIRNKPLSPADYSSFEKNIYKTGIYETVLTRIRQVNSRDSNIEVILSKKTAKDFKVSLGFDYKGTLTTDAMNDITMRTQVRKENFLGKGSIFSISGSFFTDYSLSMDYIQPIGSLAFTKLEARIENDQSIVSSGFDYYPMAPEQIHKRIVELSIGIPFSSWFTFTLGGNIGFYDTTDKIDEGKETKAFEFFAEQSINFLNSNCLPEKGFYFDFLSEAVFPLKDIKENPSFDVEQVSIESVLPLGQKFGLFAKGFAGGNFSEKMADYPEMLPVFGFYTADRNFFPNIAASLDYGLYKAAFAGGLMFSPWDQLTILGGKAFFAISGAFGNIWHKRDDISKDSAVWRTSADLGIRFSDSFGMVLRGGIGKTRNDIYPFFSIDIGKVRL